MARILLVEDEADLRDNIEVVLSHSGHEIIPAGDGAQALAALEDGPVDLVISDVSMPVMDGISFVRKVRETMPALAEMPIILLTAHGDKENMMNGRGAGADEYLAKPVDYQILNAAINARLSRARQAQDLKEKQFIRLFKQLSSQAVGLDDGPSAAPAPADPLDKVRALAPPSLHGRAALLHLDDHVPNYADMSPSAQNKVNSLMRRVLAEMLGPSDASIELGGGTALLAFAELNRETVWGKLSLARAHLDHMLGAENLASIRAADDEEDDDLKVDGETKAILQKLFAGVGDGENAPARRHHDFAAVAAGFHFDYLPVWCAQSQRIEAYLQRWLRLADGKVLTDEQALLGGYDDPMAADLTCLGMEAALHELRALENVPAAGGAPFIILPCSRGLLTSPKVRKKLTDGGRGGEIRRLGFCIHAAAGDGGASGDGASRDGAPRDGGGDFGALSFEDFSAAALAALEGGADPSVDAPSRRAVHLDARLAEKTACPRDRMRAALIDAARHAAKQGCTVWLSNVDTSVVARLAVAAGVRFISGKCIGGGKTAPGHPKKLPASQVLMTM